jgi:hypothetical protein
MSEMGIFRQSTGHVSAITAGSLKTDYFRERLRGQPMVYVKAILSGLTAIIATELLTIWWTLRPWSSAKATGVDLIFAVVKASLVQALPWIVAILLFTTFLAASRLGSKSFRVVNCARCCARILDEAWRLKDCQCRNYKAVKR